ncbi:hypothetical protein J4220_03530 [Candidatus Micrarchaeota archaeon]|nr:hypothetical protein [Candidatus Micrarchaeota archaeon]
MNETQLESILKENDASYEIKRHKPVFNIHEACLELGIKPEDEVKNLLMKDSKGFFLLIACGNTKADFSALSKARGGGKVSLASAEEVKQNTGVDVGSVNLFSYPVVFVDERILSLKTVNTHPDDNSVTFFIETSKALGLLKEKTIGSFCKEKT